MCTTARALADNGLAVSVLNVPVIKPLDADTVVAAAATSVVGILTLADTARLTVSPNLVEYVPGLTVASLLVSNLLALFRR